MSPHDAACLVLRLAGPIQSWGGHSQFNRRDTQGEPTKSGVVGLLAAAQGRRRQDPIADLLDLALGVRTDQPGSLLRDFHTVSDYRGLPLPSAAVSGKGVQKLTSPAKYTGITQRFYLQDAVFVVAVGGLPTFLTSLADAIRRPAFPLALGRRSCPPTQPLFLAPTSQLAWQDDPRLWAGDPVKVLGAVSWQAGKSHQDALARRRDRPSRISLPVTVDDVEGHDVRVDLPSTFDPKERSFTSRRVRQTWVHLPAPYDTTDNPGDGGHDPFALLGW